MDVLIITSAYPHSGNPTEGLFNEQHALTLARAGIKGTVIVCKPWLPDGLARAWKPYRAWAHLPPYEERRGIPVRYARYLHVPRYRWLPVTVLSCGRSILSAARSLHLNHPFDLIQIHGTYPAGLAAPMVARSLALPFIVTSHIEEDSRLYRSRGGAGLYKKMLEQSSAFVTVGKPLERSIRQRVPELSQGRLRIIPNGVDLAAVDEAMKETPVIERGWGHLVSVCNLWPEKGVDLTLRALAQLDRRRVPWRNYTVVGEGPVKTRLERLARDLGLGSRVDFTGRLAHQETLKEVAKADIFVLPSWREAFGVVYLEAMACGKPVIGCRGQGAEDIVHHETEGLLIEPKSIESLAGAIGYLVEHPEAARRLGAAARERAADFSWNRNVSEYIDVYRKVCAKSGE